jgi:glycosyltransferase involved in cell wall biosynthesis
MGKRSLALDTSASVRRILYVAYPLLPVSDESCGGAEQMLSVLESEISAHGHFTTVAACRGSRPSGTLFSTGPETTHLDRFTERDADHQGRILALLHETNGRQPTFDLVHDKSGSFWRRAAECNVPVLATLHLPRHFYPENSFSNLPSNLYLNCVSTSQRSSFSDVPNVVGMIPNGIKIGRFPFMSEKQDYLLWMGRICEEKGPHIAIDIAQRTGLPLVLAGQVYPFSYHQQFYNMKVRPHLGGTCPKICFVETPTLETKVRLLSHARALLVPSLVDETSSLVAMEAMACGTPVIGFRRGAIPEVVIDGVTGFVVDDAETMAEAIWQAPEINPHACRVHVESNHSAARMAAQYECLYERVLSLESQRNRLAA